MGMLQCVLALDGNLVGDEDVMREMWTCISGSYVRRLQTCIGFFGRLCQNFACGKSGKGQTDAQPGVDAQLQSVCLVESRRDI